MKIDWWTLALQTVNVIVLLWVLQRFLFKPVLAIIAQRQRAAQQLTVEAAAAKARAEEARAALETERSALATGREAAFAAMRSEAQAARDALLAQAAQESLQRGAAAQATLQRERDDAAAALRVKAAHLAADMARRLLERLPGTSWNRDFIEGACGQIAELAPAESELLRRDDGESSVQVVGADALSVEEQALVRKTLNAELGRESTITFSVDKSLIAGMELRFRHLVIRNHWAADLEKMLELLPRDDDPARAA